MSRAKYAIRKIIGLYKILESSVKETPLRRRFCRILQEKRT